MKIKDIAPIILTAVSIASSIAAVIMAINETPRAIEILDDHRLEVDPTGETDISVKEKIIDYGKGYWKTAALLGLSVSSSVASCVIGHKNYRALMASTAVISTAYAKHKDKVKKFIGEEKAKLIDQAVKKDMKEEPLNMSELVWFQEPLSGEFFQMTWNDFWIAQMTLIEGLSPEDGQISLGEVFPQIEKNSPLTAKAIWDHCDVEADYGCPIVHFVPEKKNGRCSEDGPIDFKFNEGRETYVIYYSTWPIPYNTALTDGYFAPN